MKKNKLRYNDIIAESYYLEENNGIAIVFCSGIPGISSYPEIAERYVNENFIFIQPKYLGSWESYGEFSVDNCKKTIIDFTQALLNKKVKTIFDKDLDLNIKKIYLLGHSFGASVALCSGEKLDVSGIIALAPVIDYREQGKKGHEENMEWLYDFMIAGFENVYRSFSRKQWKNFCSSGSGLNASIYLNNLKSQKILLIHGNADTSVNCSNTEKFYLKLKTLKGDVKYEETNDNHSNIKASSFERIISWIKNNELKI